MKLLLAALSMLLTGCAAMYGTPEERMAKNQALPLYSLCENLLLATSAPREMQIEWAQELDRRGEDCQRHAPQIMASAAQRQAAAAQGFMVMSQRGQQPVPWAPAAQAKPTSPAPCFRAREWVSGRYKNCVYSCMGSEATQTVGAMDMCPPGIQR